jgi:hypothetical protein
VFVQRTNLNICLAKKRTLYLRYLSMAMATSTDQRRQKATDASSHDGMTGMGLATQRHFSKVKRRMRNYSDEQEMFHYDASRVHESLLSNNHQQGYRQQARELFHRAFLDGQQASKSMQPSRTSTEISASSTQAHSHASTGTSASSTPAHTHRHVHHLNLATPQNVRRKVKTNSISNLK